MPPSSTMISTLADSVQKAFSMYMPRWYMPNSAPASPPKVPATVKAAQRMRRVSTPMKPARTLFSRTATRVRPNAEWQITQSAAMPAATIARVK